MSPPPFSDSNNSSSAANKRGEGFRFFTMPQAQDVFKMARSRRGRIGLITVSITLLIYAAAAHANNENAFLILAVLGVGALVIYDIVSRRGWEQTVTDQFQTLSRNHDRLVREVARNRTDIAVIKEGMSDTATAVRTLGKGYAPSRSIESKMIETIIDQLGIMGQKQRASIASSPEEESIEESIDHILNLEVSPPSRLPYTPGALEAALSPNFDKFSDTVILELIRHAVRNDHLDVFVQPIVSLPQRKLRMYEVFARLRANAGAYIPAARYLELAQKESLVSVIDNLLLLRCLQILRDRRNDPADIPYVLNITSLTLNDTGFMNDLVTFLAQYRNLATRLIFELPFDDVESGNPKLIEIIDGLSQLGCRFSADQVRKRRIDINMLKSRHIRFLKLDAGWLLREAHQDDGGNRIRKLKKQLDRSGLDLIVEKIEKDGELRELLEYGIDFGQGYLFGKPDLHSVYKSRETQ
jgi:cyclic-di-GMP phosphodiesterase TipF (flagellum assembly factor)